MKVLNLIIQTRETAVDAEKVLEYNVSCYSNVQ